MDSEKLKATLDFGKWLLGTFGLGVITIWVNAQYQDRQTAISQQEKDHAQAIEEIRTTHEIDIAKIEQQRVFLKSFIEHAMNSDILARIRLAHYIKSTIDDEELSKKWEAFYDELLEKCQYEYAFLAGSGDSARAASLQAEEACKIGGTQQIVAATAPGAEVHSFTIHEDRIARAFPGVPDGVVLQLAQIILESGKFNAIGAAIAIANAAHESDNFRRRVESLFYRSGDRIFAVFGRRYFDSIAHAEQFARNQEKLANHVYANRLGNGDAASGDGFRYRGRGYLQIFGRASYRRAGELIGIDLESDPEQASDPEVAPKLVVAYLTSRSRSGLTGAEWANLGNAEMVRRIVYGSIIGLDYTMAIADQINRSGFLTPSIE